jgi:hypothetical protein
MVPRRAFARPPLRPYLPDLRFVQTVGEGLCVICRGAWAGARRGARLVLGEAPTKGASRDELADKAERVGRGVLVVVIAVGAVSGVAATVHVSVLPYLPWALGVGVLGMIGAACVVAPPSASRGKIVSDGGEAASPAPEPDMEPLTVAAVAHAVRTVAVPRGWLGAHLDDVLAHLPGHSREALLDVLAQAGIPVAEQLKITLPGGRQRNRQGVRLNTLPGGLGEAPPAPAPGPPTPAPEAPAEPLPRAPHLTIHGAE